MTTRIDPVRPLYPPHTAERLGAMMPPGEPPILLYRTFVRNLPMTAAMSGWGGYELSKRLSLSMRDREIIIDRTCARCGCEYEWGVHVAFFAGRVGLSAGQITSLTHGGASDPCLTDERDRLLIEAADALHDAADIATIAEAGQAITSLLTTGHPALAPGPARIRTPADLRRYAATAGTTIPDPPPRTRFRK